MRNPWVLFPLLALAMSPGVVTAAGSAAAPAPALAPTSPSSPTPSMSATVSTVSTLSTPASGFERLKTLVGTWQGDGPEGAVTNTIRLVSNGTAIEETFQTAADNQMVTLYTPDGNRLTMTHYCSAGNQPRMATAAVSAADQEYVFAYTGITNLSSPDAPHMQGLVIRIADADHFAEQWTWRDKGQDKASLFHFTRKKA
jgi:hypothetical protein